MLCDKLKLLIRSKHRGQLSQGVVLLHDGVCPNTAADTVQTLQQLHFEGLKHPPYSPGLAPLDCNLFGLLRNALGGRRFASDHLLKEAGGTFVASRPAENIFL
jgi:histone-lysine N-methyltransferase SETMAR